MPSRQKRPTIGSVFTLSGREMEVLHLGLRCFQGVKDGEGIIDSKKLAVAARYASPKTASRVWNGIKKKLADTATAVNAPVAASSSARSNTEDGIQENPGHSRMGGNQEVGSCGAKHKALKLTTTTNTGPGDCGTPDLRSLLASEEINEGDAAANTECSTSKTQGIDQPSIKGKGIEGMTSEDHIHGSSGGRFNSGEHGVAVFDGEAQGVYDPTFGWEANDMLSSAAAAPLPISFDMDIINYPRDYEGPSFKP